jgi:hypothetical protein
MRSLREIKKSISHARVESKPEADQAVLRHLLAELAAVAGDASTPVKLHVRGRILRAMAAAAIVILAVVMVARPPQRTAPPSPENRVHSAADLLTVGCLNAAYRRGGVEAVDQRCEEAARRLDTRPERTSVKKLIRELKETPTSKG